MSKENYESEDDLLPEYDFSQMKVRRFGSGYKNAVILDDDVAEIFRPEEVNDILRQFGAMLRQHQAQSKAA